MHKGNVQILAAMLVLVGLVGAFLYLRFAKTSEPQATVVPIDTTDICAVQKSEILAVVDQFESYQKNHDADSALLMFTPPVEDQDKQDYDYLSGGGLVIARLYANIATDYEVHSYEVTSDPQEYSQGGCLVYLKEMRKLYASFDNPEFEDPEPIDLKMHMVDQDGQWKIESYKSRDYGIKDGKYSGFTLEYEGE